MKDLKNLADANKALHRVAEIDQEIATAEAEKNKAVLEAKENFDSATAGLDKEREELIKKLHTFSDDNRDEIYPDGKKSVDLTNGTIGYRQTPDTYEVSPKTAELLIAAGFKNCVKIKQEPIKAALKGFPDSDLAKYKVKRVPGGENFYVKAKEITATSTAAAA